MSSSFSIKPLQLHTPTNALIVSLAATDLLVGVLVFPFSMAFSLSSCLLHEDFICQVRDNFDISLSTCSILNLCCIAVDRYYAVCQPLTYRTRMTNSIAVAMILASWGISGLIGIGITIAGLNHEPCEENCSMKVLLSSTLGPTFSFYLLALIMLCIYLKIFLVAQRQARIIHINKNSGGKASKRERKATKTLAIVMGVFLICWTPLFVCITLVPFSADPVPVSVIETLNWVTLTNSMLNPFIYAFFTFLGKYFRGILLIQNCLDSAFYHIKNISRIRGLMSRQDLEKLINAFIFSYIAATVSLPVCLKKADPEHFCWRSD
uniref:Trace amine associated receptor 1 n=1 Tax=Poecilia reticulata TaxID=8081 RepID=A0A3P9Q6P8_POERE